MCSHNITELMGFLADGLDHGRVHLHFTQCSLFLGIQHTAGNHQFDEIRMIRMRSVHTFQCFFNVLCRISHGTCHMSAGNRNTFI